jgi:hypothetical protein
MPEDLGDACELVYEFIRKVGKLPVTLGGSRARRPGGDGNAAVWIILLAVACAAVIAVLAGLWMSYRRERRQGYTPAYKTRRRPPPSGPDGGSWPRASAWATG